MEWVQFLAWNVSGSKIRKHSNRQSLLTALFLSLLCTAAPRVNSADSVTQSITIRIVSSNQFSLTDNKSLSLPVVERAHSGALPSSRLINYYTVSGGEENSRKITGELTLENTRIKQLQLYASPQSSHGSNTGERKIGKSGATEILGKIEGAVARRHAVGYRGEVVKNPAETPEAVEGGKIVLKLTLVDE